MTVYPIRSALGALGLSLVLGGAALAQEAAPAAAPAAPAAAAPVVSTLPGGANSVRENHGDWTVSCAMEAAGKQCVVAQALGDNQTGQRVLAIELVVPAANRAEGMLLAPFGLNLAKGIALGVDGKPLGAALPFFTCIASGCLVPLNFDEASLAFLRAGTKLEINATGADSAQPVALAVSLTGFTAAAARALELAQ